MFTKLCLVAVKRMELGDSAMWVAGGRSATCGVGSSVPQCGPMIPINGSGCPVKTAMCRNGFNQHVVASKTNCNPENGFTNCEANVGSLEADLEIISKEKNRSLLPNNREALKVKKMRGCARTRRSFRKLDMENQEGVTRDHRNKKVSQCSRKKTKAVLHWNGQKLVLQFRQQASFLITENMHSYSRPLEYKIDRYWNAPGSSPPINNEVIAPNIHDTVRVSEIAQVAEEIRGEKKMVSEHNTENPASSNDKCKHSVDELQPILPVLSKVDSVLQPASKECVSPCGLNGLIDVKHHRKSKRKRHKSKHKRNHEKRPSKTDKKVAEITQTTSAKTSRATAVETTEILPVKKTSNKTRKTLNTALESLNEKITLLKKESRRARKRRRRENKKGQLQNAFVLSDLFSVDPSLVVRDGDLSPAYTSSLDPHKPPSSRHAIWHWKLGGTPLV